MNILIEELFTDVCDHHKLYCTIDVNSKSFQNEPLRHALNDASH